MDNIEIMRDLATYDVNFLNESSLQERMSGINEKAVGIIEKIYQISIHDDKEKQSWMGSDFKEFIHVESAKLGDLYEEEEEIKKKSPEFNANKT